MPANILNGLFGKPVKVRYERKPAMLAYLFDLTDEYGIHTLVVYDGSHKSNGVCHVLGWKSEEDADYRMLHGMTSIQPA